MDILLINNSRKGLGGTASYTRQMQKHFKADLLEPEDEMSDIRFLIKLMLMKKPSGKVIHAQLPIYALPFSFRKRNKIVITLHGDNMKAMTRKHGRFIGNMYRIMEFMALRRSDRIIAVDDSTSSAYSKRDPNLGIITIPVGIDLNHFKLLDKDKARTKFSLTGKVIMYVGRLRADKGVDILIKAHELVRKQVHDLELVIVGEGKDSASLKEMAGDDVKFFGFRKAQEIPEIMNCADVFVIPSLYESGPLVVPEAMACGVPCVGTDVGRMREFISDDRCGRIIDRNVEAVASMIIEVIKAGDSREHCNKAAQEFGFAKTADETLKIYESLFIQGSA